MRRTIQASTVSIRDCIEIFQRSRGDSKLRKKPWVPGFEVIGRIACIGSNIRESKTYEVGDHVAVLLPDGGGHARYASVHHKALIQLPKSNHDDIICLLSTYMTAHQCLRKAGKGTPLTNCKVLVSDAGSPVGEALIELALHDGANVFAASDVKYESHLRSLGVTWYPISNREEWVPALEGKMDVVIDTKCIEDYESSYRALSPSGILVCTTNTYIGTTHGSEYIRKALELRSWWISMTAKYVSNRVVFYDLFESYEEDPKLFKHELHYLIHLLESGVIKPKVSGRVSLNCVAHTMKLVENGSAIGAVICLPWRENN